MFHTNVGNKLFISQIVSYDCLTHPFIITIISNFILLCINLHPQNCILQIKSRSPNFSPSTLMLLSNIATIFQIARKEIIAHRVKRLALPIFLLVNDTKSKHIGFDVDHSYLIIHSTIFGNSLVEK